MLGRVGTVATSAPPGTPPENIVVSSGWAPMSASVRCAAGIVTRVGSASSNKKNWLSISASLPVRTCTAFSISRNGQRL